MKRKQLLRSSRHQTFFLAVALSLLGMSAQFASAATLIHRYSFDTNASDSVGGANGILEGGAYVTNGMLALQGADSGVQLPNDLFTNYNSVSIELWFKNGAVNNPSMPLYNFCGSQVAMGYNLGGQASWTLPGTSTEYVTLPVPAVAGTVHLVWTLDNATRTACLYVNGILAIESAGLPTTTATFGSTSHDYIGGLGFGFAATVGSFQGNILEFRIYQGALSPLQVAVSDAVGPGELPPDPGTVRAVRLIAPPPTGPGAKVPLGVFADFANVTNVNVSSQPCLKVSSDNTNVIVIYSTASLDTVGVGVADITASYQGVSNTIPVSVGIPPDVELIHRYSFSEPTNDWVVHDTVGDADGELLLDSGNSFPVSAFHGFNEMGQLNTMSYFAGGYHQPEYYVQLPPGLISCLSDVSIEAWVTWSNRTVWPWQRIFDFGSHLPGPNYYGYSYFFMTTDANTFVTSNDVARVTISTHEISGETPRLDWTNAFPLNVPTFAAVTYSPARGIAKFYINGIPVAAGPATIPLSDIADVNDWLGRSQYQQDSFFGGSYDEFRIYRGMLSDADVAADYNAGPDVIGTDYVLHDYRLGNSLVITWGTSATNWFLESSPALGPDAVWIKVTETASFQNGRFSVSVPISGQVTYFRLHAAP